MPDIGWQADAACTEADPELFFPVGHGGFGDKPDYGPAKAICRSCDVREQCLEFAFAIDAADGVFGGMSPDDRRALTRLGREARRAAKAAAAVEKGERAS